MKIKSKKQYLPEIGVCLLLGLFPLFMTNRYFNITISKFVFFAVVTCLFGILCPLFLRKGKNEPEIAAAKSKKPDSLSLAFLAFVVCGLISVAVSPYKIASLVGSSGRFMGFDYVLICGILFFFVSRYYSPKDRDFALFSLVSVLCSVLAVIQFSGFDFLNLNQGNNYYISTLGNVNVFGSFVCLSFSVSLYLIVFGKKTKYFPVYIIGAVMSAFSLVISDSDSCYLGIAAAFWLAFLLSFRDRSAFGKVLISLGVFAASAILFANIIKLIPGAGTISELSEFVLSWLMLVPSVISVLLGILVLKIEVKDIVLRIIKIAFIVASCAGVLGVAGCIFYFSVVNTGIDLGKSEQYLRFNDNWGTERGFVWRTCVESFLKMPVINKLFGCGEDTVMLLLSENFKDEMLATGYYTDNAHNEFLQQLLTGGVFGLVSYLTLLALSIKKLLKKRKVSPLFGAILTAVFSYCVQSFVNISQPITTPLMFLFLSMAGCRIVGETEEYA